MSKDKYTFKRAKRPKTGFEIMSWRFKNAKASLEIERLNLTSDEIDAFKKCIHRGYNFEERQAFIRMCFPGYDKAAH